jgi:single-strand DNA-binding protein
VINFFQEEKMAKRNDLNKVIIVGRLTRDPDVRTSKNGNSIASFRVASNRGENATFVNVKAFRKTADVCGEYLHKGDAVLVEGRLNNFKNQLEVIAQTVRFLRTKAQTVQDEPF